MSGRFVYWMNVSVDLKIEHAQGEDGSGNWLRIGESLHREFNARARALSQMVQGRKVYEIMEAFWPGARDDHDSPVELDLLEHRSFAEGVTLHRYAVRAAGAEK